MTTTIHDQPTTPAISDEEMAARLAARAEVKNDLPKTGYAGLYIDHVLQADEGCDFDFLVPGHESRT